MIKKEIIIKLKEGLAARPVAHFVQVASQYKSQITVKYADKEVNAKSIMGMMSLSLACGEEIMISASGEDESDAVEGIESYLSRQE